MDFLHSLSARVLVTLIALAASAGVSAAQVVLEYPEAQVEIRGLNRWTPDMLLDSLRVHAPGTSLASHACAAVLRNRLGFADASVMILTRGFEGRDRTAFILTVVEPQDSARVRYRDTLTDSLPDRPEWSTLVNTLEEDFGTIVSSLRNPASLLLHESAVSPLDGLDRTRRVLREFLLAHRSDANRRLAIATLESDRNVRNRMAAAALLIAFPEDDDAWHALAEAMRDPDPGVNGIALHVLHALHTGSARRVDWSPAEQALRALLDGTQLFALGTVLDLLAATADPSWVRSSLLPGWHPQIVLEMLGSISPADRQRARRFLTELRGSDMGPDPAPWAAWLNRATSRQAM